MSSDEGGQTYSTLAYEAICDYISSNVAMHEGMILAVLGFILFWETFRFIFFGRQHSGGEVGRKRLPEELVAIQA